MDLARQPLDLRVTLRSCAVASTALPASPLEEHGLCDPARRYLPIVAVDIHHSSMRATRGAEFCK
jgi:hypothetical protein